MSISRRMVTVCHPSRHNRAPSAMVMLPASRTGLCHGCMAGTSPLIFTASSSMWSMERAVAFLRRTEPKRSGLFSVLRPCQSRRSWSECCPCTLPCHRSFGRLHQLLAMSVRTFLVFSRPISRPRCSFCAWFCCLQRRLESIGNAMWRVNC